MRGSAGLATIAVTEMREACVTTAVITRNP